MRARFGEALLLETAVAYPMLGEGGWGNRRTGLRLLGEGFKITRIELSTEAEVPGIDEPTFLEHAEGAKANCPVSQALAGVDISLEAQLVS